MITQKRQELFDTFCLQVGDKVELIKEPEEYGTVISIDFNSYPFYEYGVTTCEVQWEDNPKGQLDIQWTNKLVKVN